MEDVYYIRARGKISGPFSQANLRELIRRGTLSRMQEVSSDRQLWAPAGDFTELFPASPGRPAAGGSARQRAAAAPVEDDPVAAPVTAAAPMAPVKYYYAQNGVAVGPVPAGVLQALAQNRTLGADDLVWQEGREVGTPACQLSLLAAHFSDSPRAADRPTREPKLDPAALQRAASAAGRVSLSWGLTVGVMILLCLNLPIMAVNGRAVWCWSAFGESGTGLFNTFCVFLLMSGIALCIVTPLARGTARGTVFMAISGAMGLLLMITALISDSPGAELTGVVGTYWVPAFCALLLGTCRARRLNPSMTNARTTQGVFAGLAGLCGLVVGVVLIVESRGIGVLHEAIISAYVLLTVAYFVALAAGVLGLIAAGRQFSVGLNLATMICGAACSVLIALALLLFYLGFIDAVDIGKQLTAPLGAPAARGPSPGALFMLLFRLVAMFAGLAALAGVGLFEVLMASVAPPVALRRAPTKTVATANALEHIR